MAQDQEVIEAVKAWYVSHHKLMPKGFSILERNSNYWVVLGRSDGVNEWGFKVDPKTKAILEAIGD